MKMFPKAFYPLEGDKTLHTHQVLLVLSTVFVELPLVSLRLKTNLTSMMTGPDVQLKFQEGGQIHLVAHLTSKPGLGCGGSGGA